MKRNRIIEDQFDDEVVNVQTQRRSSINQQQATTSSSSAHQNQNTHNHGTSSASASAHMELVDDESSERIFHYNMDRTTEFQFSK